MLENGQLCYCITPDVASLRKLRRQLNFALKLTHLSVSEQRIYTLSVTEWITNLIRHAQIPPDEILIELVFQPNDFNISIKDNGSPFKDFNLLINNDSAKQFHKTLPEGGIGIFLIKQAFPNLEYAIKKGPNDTYNILTLNAKTKAHKTSLKPIIAIVEDNPSVCQLISLYLQDDYEVKTFYSGSDFLGALPYIDIDLVISDITMPKMDGLEVRRRLAVSTDTQLIPFIFLTSNTEASIEQRANELGIDDFIHKPVNKQQLHNVISRVLKRRQGVRDQMGDLFEKKITATLRPELPSIISHYRCAMTSRHATAGGGDFIVHLHHNENNYIILGDVMGHGLDAKFFAHIYAGYIQGLLHSISGVNDIATMLSRFSDLIQRDIYLESIIVTCLGLSLEENGQVTIVNAGHPKPLLIKKDSIEEIDVTGTLPGLEKAPHYQAKYINLPPNRLLIFTDGFIEVGSTIEERQEYRKKLVDTAQAQYEATLSEANQALRDVHNQLVGGAPLDDVTFILLEYLPPQ